MELKNINLDAVEVCLSVFLIGMLIYFHLEEREQHNQAVLQHQELLEAVKGTKTKTKQ